ncbi:MAG: hypothetical protein U0587_01890 [Candidatus Binatia bacterium]
MGRAKAAIPRGAVALLWVIVASASPLRADTTTERSGSILIFPKVMAIVDGSHPPMDTVIQISNTSNSMVYAHCLYVNGAPLDPRFPPAPHNPPQCQEVDFTIFLTKQQPTHWVVSTGRRVEPDPTCNASFSACDGAGIDPGAIPPMGNYFTGELRCVEVDSSGAPINGNHLKGEATIVTPDGDASKYNAVGVMGLNTGASSNNSDSTLCLGGGVSGDCPTGAEYNACPQTLILNQYAADASNPVLDELALPNSTVRTELTLVPCSEDFENQIPGRGVVQFLIVNEFEQLFSTSTTVSCWGNLDLSSRQFAAFNSIFNENFLGSRFAQTRMTPADGNQSGFVGVAEEFHVVQPAGNATRAAANLHGEGQRPGGDLVRLQVGF